MVEIGSQKIQNSLGSSQCPSGRFKKVSIGITVEKCPKMGCGVRKEDTTPLPAGGRAYSGQSTQETTRNAVETLERKQSETKEQKASTWFSTRSVYIETPKAEAVQLFVNRTSILQSAAGVNKKLDAVAYERRRDKGANVARVEEVAIATRQETQLLVKGIVREEPQPMAKGSALKMKLLEILSSAPSLNKHATSSPNVEENKENLNIIKSQESQKGPFAGTKLNSQILGENKENLNIFSSQESQKGNFSRTRLNSPNHEEEKANIDINQREFQKGKVARPKQNSDTIETDSESPDQAMRRPVTRSLTRKKKPPKAVQKLLGNISYGKKPLAPSSDFELKFEKKNIFAFNEVEDKTGNFVRSASGHSNRSKEKIIEHNKVKVEPQRIYFRRSVSEKSLQSTDKEQTLLSRDKASAPSKEKEDSPLPCQGKKQFLQKLNDVSNDSHCSQRQVQNNFGSLNMSNVETCDNNDSPLFKSRIHSWAHENSPLVLKNIFRNEAVICPSTLRESKPLEDIQSPTLAMNVSPTSPTMLHKEISCSPVPDQPTKLNRKLFSLNLRNSGRASCQSDANTESSDDTREIRKSQNMESPCMMEDETKKQLSLSPLEAQDTESFEADDFPSTDHKLPSDGIGHTDKWFSNAASPSDSPLKLHRTKRLHSLNDVNLHQASPASPSPIDTAKTEEIIGSFEALDQYPEGSLARSVAQLALVLERFRTRIKLQTSKKGSEILSAVTDKIHMQLQDVESQMLADVGKFAGIGRSKRKHLELRIQEQQERLKLIHDKFKEEVNQHLMDCRATAEDLEAYHMELKGSADRQKASHRKLLHKVEEAMEAQINEAEASIASINKEARKKMQDLKRALKEWLD